MRHRRSSQQLPTPGSGGWLTTFNDMITLLMVFFVLLFTMGSLDVKRVKHFQYALQSALGVLNEGSRVNVGIVQEVNPELEPDRQPERDVAPPTEPSTALEQTRSVLGETARQTPAGVTITMEDRIGFPPGSAELTAAGKRMLDKVAGLLASNDWFARVEGHTDNRPISTWRFPSNWELSTARAVAVVQYLEKKGVAPQRLAAAGYGDAYPVADNNTAAGRSANRRVVIVLSPAR